MPFAIAHFLTTSVVMKLARLRLDNTRFLSSRELFLCAFLGLLPDIDMLVQLATWNILGIPFWPHRVFTHSIFVPIVLLIIGLLMYRYILNQYAAKLFFLASLAFAVHILLDLAFMGPVWLLAPLSWQAFGLNVCTNSAYAELFIGVDAILLVGWLFLRWVRNGRDR